MGVMFEKDYRHFLIAKNRKKHMLKVFIGVRIVHAPLRKPLKKVRSPSAIAHIAGKNFDGVKLH